MGPEFTRLSPTLDSAYYGVRAHAGDGVEGEKEVLTHTHVSYYVPFLAWRCIRPYMISLYTYDTGNGRRRKGRTKMKRRTITLPY